MRRSGKIRPDKQENSSCKNMDYIELMKTMLIFSIKHYLNPSSKDDFLSQEKWIFKKNKGDSWVFSFQFICEELELDQETLQKKIKSLATEKKLTFSSLKVL